MTTNNSVSNRLRDEEAELQQITEDTKLEVDSRILWAAIPLIIGGCISMFSNFQQDVQIIVWGVMFLIAGFGVWTVSAKKIRKAREELETKRWADLDKKFDAVNQRFDEIDARFDLSENTDKTLLRNEIVKFHREWVEDKGYITLEALEYVDRVHEAYNAVGGNDTGDSLWRDLHALPVRENRAKNSTKHS